MIITEYVNSYYINMQMVMTKRGIPKNNFSLDSDILDEAINFMYLYKSNMLEDLNEMNYEMFLLNLKLSISNYLKHSLTIDEVENKQHKIFDLVIEDMRDVFKDLYLYISKTYPKVESLLNCNVESFYRGDNAEIAYYLNVQFTESDFYTYHLPITEVEENHPKCLYNFNNHWIIFDSIIGRGSIIEFKIFIEVLSSIVNNKKYNIGFDEKIQVGFILMEFFYISEEYKYLIECADDICILANNIPRVNLKYFNGWLRETLSGRIYKKCYLEK